jgi:hypothetical protein
MVDNFFLKGGGSKSRKNGERKEFQSNIQKNNNEINK